ncbi:hypothetical protein V8J36_11985 [Frigidibacter sp. MR17.14]|uniref:hypothetical protein n=1 Tax=Frigidibacter sp. MR17.14 TaxID=3126509 RepID=UPI0030130E8C
MDWGAQVDAYCERTGFDYWSEPVNALTNLAFLAAALLVWRQARGIGRLLCAILVAIGIGSWLFHTHATRWASAADVGPILLFILTYVFAASRDFLRLPWWGAALAALAFLPFARLTEPLLAAAIPGLGSSSAYAPVPVLILIYAALLVRQASATARGLAIGAGVLIVSITFRSLDGPLCADWPLGTHFLWHLLNAAMLGWMIRVHGRHVAARRGDR